MAPDCRHKRLMLDLRTSRDSKDPKPPGFSTAYSEIDGNLKCIQESLEAYARARYSVRVRSRTSFYESIDARLSEVEEDLLLIAAEDTVRGQVPAS